MGRDVPSLLAVGPSATQPLTAVAGNANWSASVTGTDNRFFEVRNWTFAAGRPFIDAELRAGRAVWVIGATVHRQLFAPQDPIGPKIRLRQVSCEVVGLLQAKGQSTMGSDQDDLMVMSRRTFHRRIAGNRNLTLAQVSVREGESTEGAKANIERLMCKRRHIASGEQDDFSVRDMKEIANMLTGTTKVLVTLLSAVAAVSLLVGGIGIMNIMLASVTERTREIGNRPAIGALEREMLTRFLVEAVMLSSLGGVLGILLAIGAAVGLAGVLEVPFVLNARIVVTAFVFSAVVGVVFGYFPARLDPIEALRRE